MNALKKITAAFLAVLVATATLAMVASPTAESAPLEYQITTQAPGGGGNSSECPTGSIEDNKGKCRKPIADAVVCPKGALGVPYACYVFVDKVPSRVGPDVCPTGSIEDNKGDCRKPVANTTICPEGTLGAPGACYIFVPKVMKKTFKAN